MHTSFLKAQRVVPVLVLVLNRSLRFPTIRAPFAIRGQLHFMIVDGDLVMPGLRSQRSPRSEQERASCVEASVGLVVLLGFSHTAPKRTLSV